MIDYMYDESMNSRSSVVRNTERYIANPSKALAFKLGQLQFRERSTRAEDKLISKFDIREFHNAILEVGRLPLNIVRAKIDCGISQQV